MTIYPPYKKWKTVIKDPAKFNEFLKTNIDSCDTGRYTKYQGKLSSSDFLIERKLSHYNTNRPQIRGEIKRNPNNEHELTLSIESRKTIFYIVLIFSVIMVLTAIFRQNALVLIGVPVVVFWFWFVGLILHRIELRKTKLEIELILQNACS